MNRPKRTRMIILIIIIMGRFAKAVQDIDTAFIETSQSVLHCAAVTDAQVYSVPETSWSTEQSDVDAMAMAMCSACEGGAWPSNAALKDLAKDWKSATDAL